MHSINAVNFIYLVILTGINNKFLLTAGDRCFYIGLGAKPAVPKMTYEPYQCCPTKVQSPTKVAKATPTKVPAKKLDKDKQGAGEKSAKGRNKALAKSEKTGKGKKGLFGSDNIWWW